MKKEISVTLYWKGPYFLDDSPIPEDRAGIYVIYAYRLSNHKAPPIQMTESGTKILDIGQTGEGSKRVNLHNRIECWKKETPTGWSIMYKFAMIPSDEYNKEERRTIECCLRAHTKPHCGKECNDGYSGEYIIKIINKECYEPLQVEYTCSPEDESDLK